MITIIVMILGRRGCEVLAPLSFSDSRKKAGIKEFRKNFR